MKLRDKFRQFAQLNHPHAPTDSILKQWHDGLEAELIDLLLQTDTSNVVVDGHVFILHAKDCLNAYPVEQFSDFVEKIQKECEA